VGGSLTDAGAAGRPRSQFLLTSFKVSLQFLHDYVTNPGYDEIIQSDNTNKEALPDV
jgi:hypothetical protein